MNPFEGRAHLNPFDEYSNPSIQVPDMDGSKESSGQSSADTSRPGTSGRDKPRDKKRVGFNTGGESIDASNQKASFSIRDKSPSPSTWSPLSSPPNGTRVSSPAHSRQNSRDGLLQSGNTQPRKVPEAPISNEIHEAFGQTLIVPKPRPAMRRGGSRGSVDLKEDLNDVSRILSHSDDQERSYAGLRAREAHERAKRLEQDESVYSPSGSRRPSPERRTVPFSPLNASFTRNDDIPLIDLREKLAAEGDTDEEDIGTPLQRERGMTTAEAHKLVRAHTRAHVAFHNEGSGLRSGHVTPVEEQDDFLDYVPKPQQYRGSILGAILKLYGTNNEGHLPGKSSGGRSGSSRRGSIEHRHGSGDVPQGSSGNTASTTPTPGRTPDHSPPMSGATTPTGRSHRHWYSRSANQSTSSLAQFVGSSTMLGTPAESSLGEEVAARLKQHKRQKTPGMGKRTKSGNSILGRMSRPRLEDEIRITVHIAETLSRQKYLMRLCRALMQYGAPTHRLEEYMKMSARVLEIEGQFLYIPGCMIISFDDSATHTTEVKLVRTHHGVDLGKLRDTHEVYKEVVHDIIGVEEATKRLEEVMDRAPKYRPWVLVPVYGIASAAVGPFAFGARLIDLPIAFSLGCILGILQLIVAPQSDLYANVFEITAAVITSFLARAFGSIRGGDLFCFSALAQSSIALILPGYTVLCGSLELQSRSIVAGSTRMVYAIIYSLFLGFGITIGTAIYGIIDHNATSATTCQKPMASHWFFFFVPAFTLCLIVINQAKWKQAPVMMIIAFAGYVVNFFSSQRFKGNTQVSNTLGALAIGVMANLYSRLGQRFDNACLDFWESKVRPLVKKVAALMWSRPKGTKHNSNSPSSDLEHGFRESALRTHSRRVGYGLAAASMLPAIFVQVPSGLAVSGSLVSGIASANQITGNATNGTTVVSSGSDPSAVVNSVVFNVGYSVIQVAIGITVGLFLSALIVYPFGKRRSGLFSF
ncbi:hypothetical protein B0A49_09168 [Cryomyces minteri]|uniref:Threonine/serine exporter-like N-terminal domain-containing protein n=1 Tax=Cryomyces minteri TaxID=331657 RepID=A0A4U0WM38_9PEZI|nr:hypothetical protein B0A49_09168 [Cryomyces minteri]